MRPGSAPRRPRGPRSTAGYLRAVRAAIRLQRLWRSSAERRDVLTPHTQSTREERSATAIQAARRSTAARERAAAERRAAKELGLETWGTLHQATMPADGQW